MVITYTFVSLLWLYSYTVKVTKINKSIDNMWPDLQNGIIYSFNFKGM